MLLISLHLCIPKTVSSKKCAPQNNTYTHEMGKREKPVNSWKKKCQFSVCAELIIRFGEWFNHKQLCRVWQNTGQHLYKVHTLAAQTFIFRWIVIIFLRFRLLFCFFFVALVHVVVVGVAASYRCWHCLLYTLETLWNSIHMIASTSFAPHFLDYIRTDGKPPK